MTTPFIAIDWGTTNRRIYRIDAGGSVETATRDDRGILAMPKNGFAGDVAEIRSRFGDLPILCAGMVGSNRGWIEAPYVRCPADTAALAAAVCWPEPGWTGIVPGVVRSGEADVDVMRGEEVQVLGAVEAGMVPRSGLLCQPGTHCKWVWIEDGRIDRFVTAITGEMFSLLRAHSLLKAQIGGKVKLGASFAAGVERSAGGDLLGRLFGVRADTVADVNRIDDAASYVSGLLIGADVRSRVKTGEHIYVLADPTLGGLYGAAIELVGGHATLVDSHAAFGTGITRIWESIG